MGIGRTKGRLGVLEGKSTHVTPHLSELPCYLPCLSVFLREGQGPNPPTHKHSSQMRNRLREAETLPKATPAGSGSEFRSVQLQRVFCSKPSAKAGKTGYKVEGDKT